MINRYSHDEIRQIWSHQFKYGLMTSIEMHACDMMGKLRIIPKSVAESIRKHTAGHVYDIDRINEIELECMTHNEIDLHTDMEYYMKNNDRIFKQVFES